MLDRQKIETVLMRRFAGANRAEVAAAANAIMGLSDEWEEVPARAFDQAELRAPNGGSGCDPIDDADWRRDFRLFRRRAADS